MGAKKESFAKLTEDLDNLQKSEEPKVIVEEPVVPVIEPEVVGPVAEKPKVEEPKVEEPEAEKPKAEEPEAEKPAAEEPKPEEVEKAKKEDKPKDKDDDDKDEDKDKEPKKGDKKKKEDKDEDKEPVKKSESSVVATGQFTTVDTNEVTEAEFLGAFEAVIKSYSGIREELAELKKSMAELVALVQKPEVVEEPVVKSAEPAAEEPKAEPEEEPVAKSVEEPEVDSEGKAVEYVSKSNGVPELPADDEPKADPEEEPEAEFKPMDHVKSVTDYFMKNGTALSQGEKAAFRGAVGRVKRGEGTDVDIALFKEIAEISNK